MTGVRGEILFIRVGLFRIHVMDFAQKILYPLFGMRILGKLLVPPCLIGNIEHMPPYLIFINRESSKLQGFPHNFEDLLKKIG